MRCLAGSGGGLYDLRRLNLPAVLQFNNRHGGDFYAALTSLDNQSATLVLGDGSLKQINLAALARFWNGAYTLLWRAPPDYSGSLQEGATGKSVIWLRQQLAKALGEPSSDKTPRYGPELARQVREFQAAEGLRPDGIAGPLTLIRLTARSDNDAPRLIR
jgi:general secretion pathway protein A